MPHHHTPSPQEITAFAQWLWPGLVRLDSRNRTLVRWFGEPKPKIFAPRTTLDDVWLVLREFRNKGILRSFFAELEVQLGKFGFLDGCLRNEPFHERNLGHGASLLPSRFPGGLSFRKRVDLIQGFLGEDTIVNLKENIELQATALENAGIRARAVATPLVSSGRSYMLSACVSEECLRNWLRRFLHVLSEYDYKTRKSIAFKHIFHLEEQTQLAASQASKRVFQRTLQEMEGQIKRQLVRQYGVVWSGCGLDFLDLQANQDWFTERWEKLGLHLNPYLYMATWLERYGVGRHAMGLAGRYFHALPMSQQRVLVLHEVRRWSYLQIEEQLDMPENSAKADAKLAMRQVLALMRQWGEENAILSACTHAALAVMRQSQEQARERGSES
ncbi:MAG: hypothetical protein ACPG31_00605 [Planctomycetota bacterium]